MKQTGKCPKCGSDHILVFESKDKKGKNSTADFEVIGPLGKTIYTSRYVCCDCGYTERYFDDASLEKLKKKYSKFRG